MYRDNSRNKIAGQRRYGRRRRSLSSRLFRPFERLAVGALSLRWPFYRRADVLLASELEDPDAELLARNDYGLPEADLTEEQRREAIRRIRQRPRIG
jgi:hypothetical protein